MNLQNLLDEFIDRLTPNQTIPRITEHTIYGVVTGDFSGFSRPSHKEVYEMLVERGSKFPLSYGLPATHKTRKSKWMKLTPAWQNYWFGLLKLAAPGMTTGELKRAWARLTAGNRCYTNDHGSEDHADYINATNWNKPPMAKETIFTTGAILMVLDDAKRYYMAREWYYKVAILDGNKKPPALPASAAVSAFTHWATNSARLLTRDGDGTLEGREDIVNRFPQLHTETHDYDVPVPNMGNGSFDYVLVNRLRILGQGEAWPYPYNF